MEINYWHRDNWEIIAVDFWGLLSPKTSQETAKQMKNRG